MIQLLADDPELRSICAGRFLDHACGPLVQRGRQQLLELGPELLQRLEGRLRVWTLRITGRELDVLVAADDGEGGLEVLRTDAGLEQVEHVRIAGGPGVRNEVAPGAVAQLLVLDLVQLGEAGRDTGFHRALAQEARAEGVDGAGEEAFEVAESSVDAGGRVGVGTG